MRRYASRPPSIGYTFGPGPLPPAIKWIILANVAMFLVSQVYSPIIEYLGLSPERVIESGWFWQIATYMFLHGDVVHILFNMLGIWMFGTELEHRWKTQFFLRYYAVTGLGAGLTVIARRPAPVRGHGVRPTSPPRSARQARCMAC